jgi:hypothetical protein
MPQRKVNVSLVYFVVFALLLIGLVPLLLTGYFLSERSAGELRAVENRYQIQLVQEKGRQIEMFGRRHTDLVRGLASAFALANDQKVFGLPQTDRQLSNTLRENPDVLAVYVQPATGEPLALYRPTSIVKTEIDGIAQDVVRMIGNEPLYVGDPQIAGAAKEPVITMASSATNEKGRIATVVAIISLKSISRAVVGADQATEKELWDSGRPIVFVVDQNGRALFHPDVRLVQGGSVLSDLKIVSEWQESYRQIQSGLVPFSSEFDGAKHEMIGAYSTVVIGDRLNLGVITMQDEAKALKSVGEMRTQTWLISLLFALCALILGSVATRWLTSPILRLSGRCSTNCRRRSFDSG